jgi:hypothetical protein
VGREAPEVGEVATRESGNRLHKRLVGRVDPCMTGNILG